MCTTAFITTADLLLTMTTALRQNQLPQALKRVDPRQQPRPDLRRPVCGVDQHAEFAVGEGGEGGDNGLEVGVHPIVHRD
jgi:hypothetical protein